MFGRLPPAAGILPWGEISVVSRDGKCGNARIGCGLKGERFDGVVTIIMYRKDMEEEGMSKTYKIEVDCANCAEKMQEAARKTEGVADAVVSFMTQKMKVDFVEGADEKAVMKKVLKACRKVEPDCEIEI